MKLIHGDCLKILPTMGDDCVDVSFTSPPYNRKRNDKYSSYDDTLQDYFGFLCDFTRELLRVTRGPVFVNIQKNFYNKVDVNKYIGEFAEEIVETIIWNKTNPMPASGNNITNAYEYFFVLGETPLKSNFTYTKNVLTTSVNEDTSNIHKAIMKPEVCEYFIENFTKPNDIVLDCFMGTGTTGVICKKLGRDFIGIEMVQEYYNYASKRIETGFSNKGLEQQNLNIHTLF